VTAVTFWSFSGFVVVPHPVVPHPNVELIDDEGRKEGISWPTRGSPARGGSAASITPGWGGKEDFPAPMWPYCLKSDPNQRSSGHPRILAAALRSGSFE
jgi:hypothetical protein